MSRDMRIEQLRGAALSGVIVAGAFLMGASSALAEQASDQPQPAPQAPKAPQVAEVVVTAQKRSENLQKVPVSVATASAATLQTAHIEGTKDLNQAMPGLTFGTFLGYSLPYLRGVGQLQAINGIESPVAMYVDGVYLMSPGSGLMSLNDVSQIDVLRGPQGTLFGRNATGGVVQIITKNPSFSPTLDFDVGYGSFETTEAHFYASAPVTQDLAVNLALASRDREDGYATNVTTGTHPYSDQSFAAQNKWLWRPGDRTEFVLDLNYDHEKFFVDTGIAPGFVANDGVTTYGGYNIYARKDSPEDNNQYLASLKGSYRFDIATMSDQVAWHQFNNRLFFVQNPIPGDLANPNTGAVVPTVDASVHNTGATFTDELQLQSPSGQDLKWTAGAFYLSDVSTADQIVDRNETFAQSVFGRIQTTSYAAFAQATKTVLPDTRLTLGVRYSEDHISFNGVESTAPTTVAAAGIPTHVDQGAPTYRVAIDHDFSSNILGFVSWNRSFRSGGYTINNFTNPPLRSENMDSYEAGVKTKLFNNRIRFNTSAFYYNYSNIQVRASNSNGISERLNAAAGRGEGVDIDFEAAATANLTFSGGAEFLDAKYLKFPNGPCPLDLPTGGVSTNVVCDLSGKRFPFAPTSSITLRGIYRIPLPVGEMQLTLGDSYSSGYYFEPDNVLRQPSFHNIAATAGWTSSDKRWGVELWVRNLLDKDIWAGATTTGGSRTYIPGEPRTVGLTLKAHL